MLNCTNSSKLPNEYCGMDFFFFSSSTVNSWALVTVQQPEVEINQWPTPAASEVHSTCNCRNLLLIGVLGWTWSWDNSGIPLHRSAACDMGLTSLVLDTRLWLQTKVSSSGHKSLALDTHVYSSGHKCLALDKSLWYHLKPLHELPLFQ